MSKIKWIYIEDDLPEVEDRTLVTYRGYDGLDVKFAEYLGKKYNRPIWEDDGFRPMSNVIAWAEMPEPAKPRK